jgi:autotransporter-associated beta strand protein
VIVVLAASSARAVDFTFDYSEEAPDTGFNDPTFGEERREALEYAADIWGRLMRPAYPGEEVTVRAKFDAYEPGSTDLASAKPHYFYSDFGSSSPAYVPNVNYPKALANHLHLDDLAPVRPEIELRVNNAINNFYYGTDGNPASTFYDFVTVLVHEIGHGLGIFGSFRDDGEYGLHGDGSYDPVCLECLAVPYDRFLTLGPGGSALLGLGDSGREFAMTSNNVFWNGPVGIQGNGGTPPKIYAPTTWDEGSSISHLDTPTFPMDLMNDSLATGQVRQTPSAIDRGILQDLGWNISIVSQDVFWTGDGPNNKASTVANWTPALPFPGDSLGFDGGGAEITDISMDLVLYDVGAITFHATAPAYTLRFQKWTKTDLAAGVVNNSANPQTIILERGIGGLDPAPAAEMSFNNSATAANATYEIHGGTTSIDGGPYPIPYQFDRSPAGRLTFEDTTTAATATFNVEGGLGNGGDYGLVNFKGNSTANDAEFWTKGGRRGPSLQDPFVINEIAGFGGRVRFEDSATANTAHFRNDGLSEFYGGSGGAAEFFDIATAATAVFDNYGATYSGGTGGRTEFNDTSTADMGQFINHPGGGIVPSVDFPNGGAGLTIFYGNSTAGTATATFTNKGGVAGLPFGGGTYFYDAATAGDATFINEGAGPGFAQVPPYAGSTRFYENSNAGIATFIQRNRGGMVEFNDDSSAADGSFVVQTGEPGPHAGGFVIFNGNSTGGTADLTIEPFSYNAVIAFGNSNTGGTPDAADAEQAVITLQDNSGGFLYFVENSSAGQANIDIGANGRLNVGGYVINNSVATGANATIRLRPGAVGTFSVGSTVGNATITVEGAHIAGGGQSGPWGVLNVYSTAEDAVITTEGGTFPGARGGNTAFDFSASAGSATLIAGSPTVAGAFGGVIQFLRGGTAPNARVTINAGAFLDLTGNSSYGGTDIGSLEGAGTFILNGSELRTGSLNTSSAISGPLVDQPGYNNGKLTKVGTGTLTLGGVNTYTGLTKVNAGTLAITGTIPGNVEVNSGGTLIGIGNIGGTTTVNGGFAPGASAGTITIGGLAMSPGGTLDFELGDPERDHIIVTDDGNISLAGTLTVSLIGGFTPALGQSFALFEGAIGSVTGAFSSIVAPVFNGHTFGITYGASSAMVEVVLAGDFNRDGSVNAADYVAWRKGFGTIYTQNDFNIWRAHFGQTVGGGAGDQSSKTTAPEPASVLLLSIGLAMLFRNA